MLAKKLLSTTAGEKLYVDDVFSTYIYTGNGSTQTINNGIDLAGEGGLVWLKNRTNSNDVHNLYDTVRGEGKSLVTSHTAVENAYGHSTGLTSFTPTGFQVGAHVDANRNGESFASWTFRRAKKFFDIVTYTGNGVAGRQIPHGLGIEPGMIVVKRTDATADWIVWHRGTITQYYTLLNSTAGQAFDNGGIRFLSGTGHTEETFELGPGNIGYTHTDVNAVGGQYVAYLWAHDPSEDGIIQCGSFTTDGSGNATVNLGWEPQWLQLKVTSATGGWIMHDVMRGWSVSSYQRLVSNLADDEGTISNSTKPNSTGFDAIGLAASQTYIYLAIRRPNKPPKSGMEVFMPIVSSSGEGTKLTTSFSVDTQIIKCEKNASTQQHVFLDRLRGVSSTTSSSGAVLFAGALNNESSVRITRRWDNLGFDVPYLGGILPPVVYWSFRRAPGFFDVVCYTASGISPSTVTHGLGVIPEFIIVKCRSNSDSSGWVVYHSAYPSNTFKLNTNGTTSGAFVTTPTSNTFTLGGNVTSSVNVSNQTYVAYLFATLPGISKIGSYTGNGSSQTIDCGFTTGARFILIKRTDASGDWYIWDSARGIVAANDPHLSLNTTAAEVTTNDSVDPTGVGFIVNQNTATNINVSGGTYIYLAIA